MKPDEKFCPLCNMTCKGEECGWWRHPGCCAVSTIATSIHGIDLEISRVVDELFCIRKELENR
jgi:hypothetical protein